MQNVRITNGDGDSTKMSLIARHGYNGPPVFTEPLLQGDPSSRPYLNADFGSNMNQNGAFGGTPEKVHNGTDNVYWTGSEITGNDVTFNSTDQANTGTKSVKVSNPNQNDVWQFDKGSDLTISGYTALTFFIFVDKDWSTGESVEIFGFDTGTELQVGVRVAIEDYFDEFNFDVWQKVTIPLSDMGLTSGTIDALRMEMVGSGPGKNPKFYIDDMQFEQTGTPIEFKVEALSGTRFHVTKLVFSLADVGTGGTALAYNKFGALSALTNGVNLKTTINEKPLFTATFKQLSDWLDAGVILDNTVDDGTNTYYNMGISLFETKPVILDSRNEDVFTITISDDLTGLLHFRAFARGWEEKI